jgi:hypothetical protein
MILNTVCSGSKRRWMRRQKQGKIQNLQAIFFNENEKEVIDGK